MCGIAGFNWQDETLSRDIANVLRHRGPDAVGFFAASLLSLVHTRLSIVDLHERSNQPLHYHHGERHYVLVFNGEIYNYQQLRRELERAGCRFQTKTDSEVITAGYAVWGSDCVRHFNGMWAFAIYDECDNKLFLSRDRFGKKPFYYHASDSRFIFASEIKAILRIASVSREADAERVSDLLNFGCAAHTDGTFFRDVRQLPAGSNGILDLRNCQFRVERYYAIPASPNHATAVDVHNTLRAAVARRLISDVPVCLSLSGGVDSSSIAALLAEIHDNRMLAFTTTSNEGLVDETANVMKLLARYPQFELVRVPVWTEDLPAHFERVVYHMDEPFLFDSPFVRWRIAQAIHERGFKVSLTGEGADEILAGYDFFSPVFLRDLWRRRNLGRLAVEMVYTFRQPEWRAVLSQFVRHLLGSRRRRQRRRADFLDSVRRMGCRLPPTAIGAALKESDHETTLKEKLYSQVRTFFLPYLLACDDKMYMAHAVEARAPFLDLEVVELCLGIATNHLIQRAIRKYPLREAMRDRVPAAVLFDRRKIGFASTVGLQLSRPDARNWVSRLFSDAHSEGFVDPKAFLAAYDAVPPGAAVSDFFIHAISLEVWMRQFGVTAPPVGQVD